MDTKWESGVGWTGEIGLDTYTLLCIELMPSNRDAEKDAPENFLDSSEIKTSLS